MIALAHYYQYVRGDVLTALRLLKRFIHKRKMISPDFLSPTSPSSSSSSSSNNESAMNKDFTNDIQNGTSSAYDRECSLSNKSEECSLLVALSFCYAETDSLILANINCKSALLLDPTSSAGHRCAALIAMRLFVQQYEQHVQSNQYLRRNDQNQQNGYEGNNCNAEKKNRKHSVFFETYSSDSFGTNRNIVDPSESSHPTSSSSASSSSFSVSSSLSSLMHGASSRGALEGAMKHANMSLKYANGCPYALRCSSVRAPQHSHRTKRSALFLTALLPCPLFLISPFPLYFHVLFP